jgi:acyl carrier protein
MPKYTVDEIRAGVRQLIAEVTEKKPEQIQETASFDKDLGIDSLMATELMVAMERKYRIKIPEQEFTKIRNVKDAIAATQRHLAS